MLDIGTHWGAVSQHLSACGFRCTAIERNPEVASIARRLRDAVDGTYAVIEGDALDLEQIEGRYDAVLVP